MLEPLTPNATSIAIEASALEAILDGVDVEAPRRRKSIH